MPSVFEIEKPEDAWKHVGHCVGNQLQIISGVCQHPELNDDQRFNQIVGARVNLFGNLCALVRCMNGSGFPQDAANIQVIADMVFERDVTDAAVREAIKAKHQEFDAKARDFVTQLRALREQHKS